jgi:hypothetical protein
LSISIYDLEREKKMKCEKTGILRQIDDLGRIQIPKLRLELIKN